MNYRDTLEKEVNALYFFSKCHSGGGGVKRHFWNGGTVCTQCKRSKKDVRLSTKQKEEITQRITRLEYILQNEPI